MDLAAGGFPLIPAAALVNDNAFAVNLGANGAAGFGFRVPDIIANLRR